MTAPKRTVTLEDQYIALDRGIRLALLGFTPKIDRKDLARRLRERGKARPYELDSIADLLDGKKRAKHRPKSAEAALKNHTIAQLVFYREALNPKMQRKAVVSELAESLRVSPSSVWAALAKLKLDPQMEKDIKSGAAAFAEWYLSSGGILSSELKR